MQPISQELFESRLVEVLSCGGLELEFRGGDCHIPYMMSDAVESILILKNCHITGQFIPGKARAEFVYEPRPAIIFRQDDGNIFTLWYEETAEETNFYRYDPIAHFWVPRLEQWRRLTYMIGTMHDKYTHLGEAACNNEEKEIFRLIEFGPFRAFTPVEFSLDYRYEESTHGARLMESIAFEAGDRHFARLCRLYACFPNRFLRHRMAVYLGKAKAIPIHQLIYEKTMRAASAWPERSYGEEKDRQITGARMSIHQRLTSLGFQGEYPLYRIGDAQVLAVEEHPFTQFEDPAFVFSIRYMVSMSPKKGVCAGFFFGKGNYSYIANSLDDILNQQGESNVQNN